MDSCACCLETEGSMQISVCRSCAWILDALCVCLIEQQLAMLQWLVPGLKGPICSRQYNAHQKQWAGRVNAFLSHAPPSWEDCHPSEEASVAEVDCADAVPTAGISNGLSVCLGCPVFKRDFEDDRTGNLWTIERLTPCKLAAVPHCSHPDNLVILSCFASFMHQVPEVS